MAQATRTYVGLDIGTTKISCIIAEKKAPGELNIVGVGNAPSEGLRRGVVVDLEKTVASIQRAVDEAERIFRLHVGVPLVKRLAHGEQGDAFSGA